MNSYDLICDAMRRQKVLELIFDSGECLVEPHAFGRDVQGRDVLIAYQLQVSGASPYRGWRLFDLARILSVSICPREFFGPRPDFHLDDRALQQPYCLVG